MNVKEVIRFWFEELSAKQCYTKSNKLDLQIKERFLSTHDAACKGELYSWRKTPLGRLAEIIVFDQFSRNIYRNDKRAFLFDPIALVLAQEAVSLKTQDHLTIAQKPFLFHPFMHSESMLIHELAIELYSMPGLEKSLKYELKHKDIIERFGRYPHRNEILGRASTAEELKFLEMPGSSF
jgi:uncharacterized protein (DUF924 family)